MIAQLHFSYFLFWIKYVLEGERQREIANRKTLELKDTCDDDPTSHWVWKLDSLTISGLLSTQLLIRNVCRKCDKKISSNLFLCVCEVWWGPLSLNSWITLTFSLYGWSLHLYSRQLLLHKHWLIWLIKPITHITDYLAWWLIISNAL